MVSISKIRPYPCFKLNLPSSEEELLSLELDSELEAESDWEEDEEEEELEEDEDSPESEKISKFFNALTKSCLISCWELLNLFKSACW